MLQATYHALSNLLYYPFHYNVHSQIPSAFVIEFLLGKYLSRPRIAISQGNKRLFGREQVLLGKLYTATTYV